MPFDNVCMSDRSFRFGVVATPQNGREAWLQLAQHVENMGYSTLLMPDGMQLLAPFVSLAAAATATTSLRVGTFVVASPLRAPRLAAWDAHSTSVMTGGRFEFGIGTGRPEAADQAVDLLGMPAASPAQRLRQVEQTIAALRELDGDQHTPVMIAAGGPRARAVAAAKADVVALAAPLLASRDEVARTAAEFRITAGGRYDQIELSMNIFVVGDQVPQWVERFIGADAATLIQHDALTMLRGGPTEIADELRRRRDTFDVSYVTVNAAFADALAPVVEQLTGR
jgi:alkanesulfonate monooxygenase SsuD/methylene tetrahydromethanopterin reductase-like flavin-dependent oxidoreductase (luciferase family)